jgi:hypothetical protein
MVLEGRPKEETDTVLTFCDKVIRGAATIQILPLILLLI